MFSGCVKTSKCESPNRRCGGSLGRWAFASGLALPLTAARTKPAIVRQGSPREQNGSRTLYCTCRNIHRHWTSDLRAKKAVDIPHLRANAGMLRGTKTPHRTAPRPACSKGAQRDDDPPDQCLIRFAPRHIGRSGGGLKSKRHAVCCSRGHPLLALLSEGQMSDHKGAAQMINALPPSKALLGDRDYDADWSRTAVAERAGLRPASPQTSTTRCRA